jgi:hypothetical protein
MPRLRFNTGAASGFPCGRASSDRRSTTDLDGPPDTWYKKHRVADTATQREFDESDSGTDGTRGIGARDDHVGLSVPDCRYPYPMDTAMSTVGPPGTNPNASCSAAFGDQLF